MGTRPAFAHGAAGLGGEYLPNRTRDRRVRPLHASSFVTSSALSADRRGWFWAGGVAVLLCAKFRSAELAAQGGEHVGDARGRRVGGTGVPCGGGARWRRWGSRRARTGSARGPGRASRMGRSARRRARRACARRADPELALGLLEGDRDRPPDKTDARGRPPRSVAGCGSWASITRHTGAGAGCLAGCSGRPTRTGDAAAVPAARPAQPHPLPSPSGPSPTPRPSPTSTPRLGLGRRRPRWLLDRAHRGAGAGPWALLRPRPPTADHRAPASSVGRSSVRAVLGLVKGATARRGRRPPGPSGAQTCSTRARRRCVRRFAA
jgi:hypothetical protein